MYLPFSDSDNWDKEWKYFLETYSNLILKVCWSFCSDYDQCMNYYLYICTRLKANNYRVLEQYDDKLNENSALFTTWLTSVVRNMCIDFHRNKNGRARLPRLVQKMSDETQYFYHCYFFEHRTLEEIELLLQTKYPDCNSTVLDLKKNLEIAFRKSGKPLPRKSSTVFLETLHDKLRAEASTSDSEAQSMQYETLQQAIDMLHPRERLAVKLHYFEKMQLKDIAEVLQLVPDKKIYYIMKKIMQKLRRLYLKQTVE